MVIYLTLAVATFGMFCLLKKIGYEKDRPAYINAIFGCLWWIAIPMTVVSLFMKEEDL